MKSRLKRKWLTLICIVLLFWIMGIIITPLLAGSGSLQEKRMASFMYFFYKPVCHQMVDRSFEINGYIFAVCVRCFGFYLGGLFISLLYWFKRDIFVWKLSYYIMLIIPAIIDFICEKIDLYTNLESLRFITGLLLGIAVFQLLLASLLTESYRQNSESLS